MAIIAGNKAPFRIMGSNQYRRFRLIAILSLFLNLTVNGCSFIKPPTVIPQIAHAHIAIKA